MQRSAATLDGPTVAVAAIPRHGTHSTLEVGLPLGIGGKSVNFVVVWCFLLFVCFGC